MKYCRGCSMLNALKKVFILIAKLCVFVAEVFVKRF